jgi:DNA-binding transcriptional LysR family regulator
VIAGLTGVTAGAVTVLGTAPRAARTRRGYMFARDALMPWRTTRGNVEFALESRGAPAPAAPRTPAASSRSCVELTVAGRHLLRHAELMQHRLVDARRELRSLGRGEGAAIRVGAGPVWLRRILPGVIAAYHRDHPTVSFRVAGGFDRTLTERLKEGEFDFLLAEVPWQSQLDELDVEPLTKVELLVHVRAGHPLLDRPNPVALDALEAYPWVLPDGAPTPGSGSTRSSWPATCRRRYRRSRATRWPSCSTQCEAQTR